MRLIIFILSIVFIITNIEAKNGCCSHHGGVKGCICADGTPLSSKCLLSYPKCNNTSTNKVLLKNIQDTNNSTIKTSLNYLENFISLIPRDQILHKKAFTIYYNYKHKTPNIVFYTLYANLVNKNNYSRKGFSFRPDFEIPKKYRSYSNDYTHSGYDRGHNAPNASFDYNRSIQKETFLMSNIAPQAKWLNRKYWAKVERLARFLAVKYKKIEVVTGNCGSIGHLKNNVNIPAYWFKIIYIPKNKKSNIFLVPNKNDGMKTAKIKKYQIDSIDKIIDICNFKKNIQ